MEQIPRRKCCAPHPPAHRGAAPGEGRSGRGRAGVGLGWPGRGVWGAAAGRAAAGKLAVPLPPPDGWRRGKGSPARSPRSWGLARSPPHRPPAPPASSEGFAKCWLALLNFCTVLPAPGNTADVLRRCVATKGTRIDLVTNGPLRNWREEEGRCKIYKCPLFRGRRGGCWAAPVGRS